MGESRRKPELYPARLGDGLARTRVGACMYAYIRGPPLGELKTPLGELKIEYLGPLGDS